MITQNSIMVTAHRDLAPEDHTIIQTTMAAEVASPVDIIYFGGAFGGDTLALEASLHARRFNAKIHQFDPISGLVLVKPELIVVLPKTLKDHRSDLHEIIKRADSLVELKLSRKIYADIWWEHDKWMIDHSHKCLAFWDGIEYGGTYNAIKYAEKQGILVEIIKIAGRNR